jgi:hypothetical protein
MNLQDKIKEIQQKPEHIRLRYVWGCVAISMFFIVVLWVFSMTAGRVSSNESGLSESQIMQEFQTQKQSMEEYKNQLKDVQSSFKDLQNQAQNQPESQSQDTTNVNNQNLVNSNQ